MTSPTVLKAGNMGTDGETWGQTGRSPVSLPIWNYRTQKNLEADAPAASTRILRAMARFARVVIPDVPLHVTQRGNARQVILADDADRLTYLALLREQAQLYRLFLLGYCLMSNHVHLIAVPHTPVALAQSLKQTHGRYASYWNVRHTSTGHVWQGRFYSCPLDEEHLWAALRYVELNPVRAGIVETAEAWTWSSAAAHCGLPTLDPMLSMAPWRQRWTVEQWRNFLGETESGAELSALRQATPYRAAAGEPGICSRAGAFHIASAGSRQRRPTKEIGARSAPAQLHVRGVETGERPVCPRFSVPGFPVPGFPGFPIQPPSPMTR